MFPAVAAMSNSTSLSEETSISSGTRVQDFNSLNPPIISTLSPPPPQQQQQQKIKKKRSLPGNPGKLAPSPYYTSELTTHTATYFLFWCCNLKCTT